MTRRNYAIVRVDNQKHTETYSDPIMVGDSLDELQAKLSRKNGDLGSMDLDLGLDDWDDGGDGFL